RDDDHPAGVVLGPALQWTSTEQLPFRLQPVQVDEVLPEQLRELRRLTVPFLRQADGGDIEPRSSPLRLQLLEWRVGIRRNDHRSSHLGRAAAFTGLTPRVALPPNLHGQEEGQGSRPGLP